MLSVACKIKCCQSAIGSSHILKTSVWRPKNNKSSKLISRQVYCSRLCGSWLISCNKLCLIISNNTLKLNYKVFEWLWLQTDVRYCSRRQMWILEHPDQCLLHQSQDKLKKSKQIILFTEKYFSQWIPTLLQVDRVSKTPKKLYTQPNLIIGRVLGFGPRTPSQTRPYLNPKLSGFWVWVGLGFFCAFVNKYTCNCRRSLIVTYCAAQSFPHK